MILEKTNLMNVALIAVLQKWTDKILSKIAISYYFIETKFLVYLGILFILMPV